MLDERGFRQGRFFTAVLMGIIIGLIVCRDVWFVCALTYNALLASKISNHDENFLGGGFVGAGEFYRLSEGDLFVLDGCLVHEVLADDD